MTRAEEQALKAYPKRGWKCKDAEGNDKFLDANRECRLAFVKGYEQVLRDIWHDSSEKPGIDAKIVVYHDDVIGNTTMRNYIRGYKQFNPDKWCYLDDILPKE